MGVNEVFHAESVKNDRTFLNEKVRCFCAQSAHDRALENAFNASKTTV
ncbi:hypothetical protein NIES2104_09640 [Leptolyngbya sp. NIES-2104]|nr:hypothetical protein NIES2104_09640 [Leptolyngbya sp. NIES-2104]